MNELRRRKSLSWIESEFERLESDGLALVAAAGDVGNSASVRDWQARCLAIIGNTFSDGSLVHRWTDAVAGALPGEPGFHSDPGTHPRVATETMVQNCIRVLKMLATLCLSLDLEPGIQAEAVPTDREIEDLRERALEWLDQRHRENSRKLNSVEEMEVDLARPRKVLYDVLDELIAEGLAEETARRCFALTVEGVRHMREVRRARRSQLEEAFMKELYRAVGGEAERRIDYLQVAEAAQLPREAIDEVVAELVRRGDLKQVYFNRQFAMTERGRDRIDGTTGSPTAERGHAPVAVTITGDNNVVQFGQGHVVHAPQGVDGADLIALLRAVVDLNSAEAKPVREAATDALAAMQDKPPAWERVANALESIQKALKASDALSARLARWTVALPSTIEALRFWLQHKG